MQAQSEINALEKPYQAALIERHPSEAEDYAEKMRLAKSAAMHEIHTDLIFNDDETVSSFEGRRRRRASQSEQFLCSRVCRYCPRRLASFPVAEFVRNRS